MHLWFLVHGLFGDVGNLEVMQETIASAIPKSDKVYIASSNQGFYTFDGVEVGALRLYDELMHVVAQSQSPVTHISIIGYSLGGLYTRYLIGLLEENGFFESVEPVIYASFASPHLGSTQWNPKYASWLLNGIGNILLGVSGSELLCRWRCGLVHALSEPDSKYFKGLARFRRRFLFANAVNDRSVHFWTAFITNKVPFAKDHEHTSELAFYSYNGDPQGHFIVDLQRSRHIDKSRPSAEKKSIVIFIPIMIVALLFISLRSWICFPFLKIKWRVKYSRLKKKYLSSKGKPTQELSSRPSGSATSPASSISHDHNHLESRAQMALDNFPPRDYEGADDESSVTDGPTTTAPKPVLKNKAAFVDTATKELPFSNTMTQRMNNLNSLDWEKYVVYLEGWSHAHIINRRNLSDSQGTQLLKFFTEEALKTTALTERDAVNSK